jgi:hypothetical protein
MKKSLISEFAWGFREKALALHPLRECLKRIDRVPSERGAAWSALADIYIQGTVVERNAEDALKWYERAAAIGDSRAQDVIDRLRLMERESQLEDEAKVRRKEEEKVQAKESERQERILKGIVWGLGVSFLNKFFGKQHVKKIILKPLSLLSIKAAQKLRNIRYANTWIDVMNRDAARDRRNFNKIDSDWVDRWMEEVFGFSPSRYGLKFNGKTNHSDYIRYSLAAKKNADRGKAKVEF